MTVEVIVPNISTYTQNDIQTEILLAETRMNEHSAVRFHIKSVDFNTPKDTTIINEQDF